MQATQTPTLDSSMSSRRNGCGSRLSRSGNWSGFNIAVMVAGFVLFWPVGMLILFWILSGRDARDLPGKARQLWSSLRRDGHVNDSGPTDNTVFNAYHQTQYDRIRELKEEIRESKRRFDAFRADARRRADEEEFNRFMADTPDAPAS